MVNLIIHVSVNKQNSFGQCEIQKDVLRTKSFSQLLDSHFLPSCIRPITFSANLSVTTFNDGVGFFAILSALAKAAPLSVVDVVASVVDVVASVVDVVNVGRRTLTRLPVVASSTVEWNSKPNSF